MATTTTTTLAPLVQPLRGKKKRRPEKKRPSPKPSTGKGVKRG